EHVVRRSLDVRLRHSGLLALRERSGDGAENSADRADPTEHLEAALSTELSGGLLVLDLREGLLLVDLDLGELGLLLDLDVGLGLLHARRALGFEDASERAELPRHLADLFTDVADDRVDPIRLAVLGFDFLVEAVVLLEQPI